MDTAIPTYISLNEASNLCPHRPWPGTIARWIRKGQKARNGERIKLRGTRIGGRLYTTKAWLRDYWKQLEEADQQHFDRHQPVILDEDDSTDAVLKEFGID